MKRRDLIRPIEIQAKQRGVVFEFLREGAGHSIVRWGSTLIVIPRHREISERTARRILRQLDGTF